MADCECLPGCPFFNDKMANKPATADLLKREYCLGDNKDCARYRIFKTVGREHVPPDLFPIQHDRAERILAGLRKS